MPLITIGRLTIYPGGDDRVNIPSDIMHQFVVNASDDYGSRGLTQMELDLLPMRVCEWDFIDQICTICYENFEENPFISTVGCQHLYHYECLRKWMVQDRRCPNCREVYKRVDNSDHDIST